MAILISRFRRHLDAKAFANALGTGLLEDLHWAGSPQTQRIMISRLTDLEAKKKLAKTLAGIEKKLNYVLHEIDVDSTLFEITVTSHEGKPQV